MRFSQPLFSAGHNVHHEPQSARRIFTASCSDHCASFLIIVTLHYKALANQVVCLHKLNILSRQFEMHPISSLSETTHQIEIAGQ
jgi:hypothetical protein